jgi:aminopeptidase N
MDKETQKKFPLQRSEAEFRKSELTDEHGQYKVTYDLILVLRKLADTSSNHPNTNFEGRLMMNFLYHGKTQNDLFLNFNGEVKEVRINDQVVTTNYKERRIYIDHTKLRNHENNEVIILFSAKYERGGVGLHHFVDPMDQREYLYTQFEPYECHLVFPVFDQPDIKATLSLTLVGPDEWVLLGNEHEKWAKSLNEEYNNHPEVKEFLISRDVEEGDQVFLFNEVLHKNYKIAHFETTPKISSYLYALCAGPYHCIDDKSGYKVPLRIFMRQSLKNCGEPDEFFRITIAGMEWYKNFFGLAYPFNKYDQIYTPEYNFGAMENVGLVTYNELYCWKDAPTQSKRSRFCITVLHELAHMWFGNLVTMKWWDDLWLNESFATFISFLCQAQAVGNEYPISWAQFNTAKGVAYREDQKVTTHPVIGDITDTDKAQSHFDGIVYYKGSSILKQMFYFIGEENFSNGLKEYFKIYAYNNTVFDDFVDQMVIALGEKNTFDLKHLCREWIGKSGLNEVEAEWDSENGKVKEFRVKQKPCLPEHANLQTHMIDILLIYDHDKSEVIKNVMIKNQEVTVIDNIKGTESPKAVVLNYNDWAYLKWTVDEHSLTYLGSNLYNIKSCDLLTRQLYYRSLYDMVRDARISFAQYLDIVNVLLKQETDDEIINTSLRIIMSLITYYVPLKYFKDYSTLMFNLVSFLLHKHSSNKDVTMNLMDILIGFATTDEHTKLLKQWLTDEPHVLVDGNKTTLPKELLSQDNRFSIVTLIHKSTEIPSEEKHQLLEAEIERDKHSDRSIRAKCKCRSILPDKKIKEEVWNKIINEPSSESLYNMRSYMAGFAPIEQLDLVKDFLVDKFFEDAKTVGKQEHFYVDAFVGSCAPIFFVDDENFIEKIDNLAKEIENDSLKRRLLELTDDMRRFAKAQKLIENYLKEKHNK